MFLDLLSVFPVLLDVMLAMPLYPVDGFHYCAMRGSVDDSEVDWVNFAKEARVQTQSWSEGTLVTSKNVIFIWQALNEASSAGVSFFFPEHMINAISCCRFLLQDRALPNDW